MSELRNPTEDSSVRGVDKVMTVSRSIPQNPGLARNYADIRMINFICACSTLFSLVFRRRGLRTHLAVLGDLFQVVSQDILPAVAAGEALVQRLEVQVLGLQVAELGLYRLPLLDDDLEQSLHTGTVNRRGEGGDGLF